MLPQRSVGRIGVLICYDAWFPEAARTLARKGAQRPCPPPTAPDEGGPKEERGGARTLVTAHPTPPANANRLFVACANRVGDGYLGCSCIVDPTGRVLALGDPTEE